MLFIDTPPFARRPLNPMILTCPACTTKYVVKDGAIPPAGRQVRCASCKHSWHQDPEASDSAAAKDHPEEQVASAWSQPQVDQAVTDEPVVEASAIGEPVEAPPPPAAPQPTVDERQWAPVEPASPWDEAAAPVAAAPAQEDFEPFYDHEPIDERPKSKLPLLAMLVLLVALAAIAFWFLAPAEMKARVGIASAGSSQLDVVLNAPNSQKLASGNNLFTLSGRIVNGTDQIQTVPPIQAELLDAGKHVVYSWTIPPPAPTLQPSASAPFNSAEVDVPDGGKHIRVRLGGPA